MTRTAFFKAAVKRFAPILFCLALAVYTYYQILGTSSAGIVTTTVKPITDTQKISGEGYLFREEKVLTSDLPGVVQPLVSDGQKVSCGTEVVRVWTDYSASEIPKTQQKLEELDAEIAILTDSKIPTGTSYSNLSGYRKDADTHFMELKKSVAAGDYQTAVKRAKDLRIDLYRVEDLLNPDYSPETALRDLETQKADLLKGNSETLVTSDSSAYFYAGASVDGYENLFTPEVLDYVTAEKLYELKAASPEKSENIAGKLVYGYDWSMAIVLQDGYAEDFTPGAYYTMTFPESRNISLSMCCRSVWKEEGVAVFACNEDPSDFSYLRVQTVEITVGQTHGLYLPESALITTDDGQIGVYIFESNTARFCRLTVLYRGDGYVIVAEGGELALNDLVIISARDLYDGRTY